MRQHHRVRTCLTVAALTVAIAACQRQEAPQVAPKAAATAAADTFDASAGADARRIEADVRFLADDLLEGREAGTRGYDLAARYVAERFRAIGLAPAGDDGGYLQRVPLLRAVRVADGARLAITRDGTTTELRFKEQFLPSLNFNAASATVTAPAVFVGQGVHAPELKHDDFAGVDLRGKIAVLFGGAPERFDNDRRAFYSSGRQKLQTLAERGAIGVLYLGNPEDEKRSPWAQGAENWQRPGMRLRGDDGKGLDTWPQLQVAASANADSVEAVLGGSGRTATALFAALKSGTLQAFDLPGTLTLAASTRIENAESHNVVAKLAGADDALGKEHIAYSAHLDHVGIGAPVDGDAIYNGALDNALGVAVMLEAAQQLARAESRPKRSLLFVAVTAEEKGLLGSDWFAQRPTVPRDSLVANVNLDMPVLLTPTTDVVPIGIEHSTLQPLVAQAAKDIGVQLSPDPFPEEVVFVRSDQFSFIRAGIPAVYLDGGVVGTEGVDGKASFEDFLRGHYHRPSDDTSLPIQYADAARLARLNARIGQLIADAKDRPAWNPGDFFGERYGRKPADAAPTPAVAPAGDAAAGAAR